MCVIIASAIYFTYMIEAIVFDFGNVICKFDNDLFVRKISDYTSKSFEELNDLIYKKSDLPKMYETGLITSDEFFSKISELCGLNMSKDKFVEAYTNIFTPIESTIRLIKDLRDKYRLALLSNTSEWDFEFGIKQTDVFDVFEQTSLSFEVNTMKPDEQIYKDCLKKLNLSPGECVYIDDVKEYADAATQLGMIGIYYTSHEDLIKRFDEIGVNV